MGWSLTVNIKNRVYIVCRNILSTACTHDLFFCLLIRFSLLYKQGFVFNCRYYCYLLITPNLSLARVD